MSIPITHRGDLPVLLERTRVEDVIWQRVGHFVQSHLGGDRLEIEEIAEITHAGPVAGGAGVIELRHHIFRLAGQPGVELLQIRRLSHRVRIKHIDVADISRPFIAAQHDERPFPRESISQLTQSVPLVVIHRREPAAPFFTSDFWVMQVSAVLGDGDETVAAPLGGHNGVFGQPASIVGVSRMLMQLAEICGVSHELRGGVNHQRLILCSRLPPENRKQQ